MPMPLGYITVDTQICGTIGHMMDTFNAKQTMEQLSSVYKNTWQPCSLCWQRSQGVSVSLGLPQLERKDNSTFCSTYG